MAWFRHQSVVVTALAAGLAAQFAPPAALAAPPPAAKQSLYVWETGTGTNGDATYVVYSLPSLKVEAYTPYYSFSNFFGAQKGHVYFADQGTMYSFKKSKGAITPTPLFGASNSGGVALDSRKHIYTVDSNNSTVDEYTGSAVAGGGTKTPLRVLPVPQGPQYLIVDHQDHLWVVAGSNVIVFGSTGTTPIATFAYSQFVKDIVVDTTGAVWVLGTGDQVQYHFSNGCTMDPNGSIVRFKIISKYVNLRDVSDLYTEPSDTNMVAQVAVDSTGRVYYSAQNEIVDYDPGAQCPNDALLISNQPNYANDALAIDARNNLYAAITQGPDTISVYPPASTTPVQVLTQTIAGTAVQMVVQ